MREVVEEVFAAVVELLIEEGYVKLDHYFVDGTKMEANANKHKAVWAKSTKRYKEQLQKKIEELNERLRKEPKDKKLAKAVRQPERDYLLRQKKYEEQERKFRGRNSYSRTDEDATFIAYEGRLAESLDQAGLQRSDRY